VTEADATGSPAHPEQGRADAKVRLRHELLERRRALTPEQIATARRAVAAQVLTRAARDGWRTVAAYEPFRTEPGSVDLLTGLRDLDITVLVPVLLPDRDLDWRVWPDGAPLGVDAVRRCDALLLPALAVAPSGARLARPPSRCSTSARLCRPCPPTSGTCPSTRRSVRTAGSW
jgi:5-formyltetrahydrofolate cyclo-ligase